MINKKEVIKIIDQYIEVIQKDLDYYYITSDFNLTEDQQKIVDYKVMQKVILNEVLKDIENLEEVKN